MMAQAPESSQILFAKGAAGGHQTPMDLRSPFGDTESAILAWARYRRLMRFMFGVTIAVVIIALALIYKQSGMVSIHLFIATALGIGFAMLLMSALMGLVFLSSSSGHDETVSKPLDDQPDE